MAHNDAREVRSANRAVFQARVSVCRTSRPVPIYPAAFYRDAFYRGVPSRSVGRESELLGTERGRSPRVVPQLAYEARELLWLRIELNS